MLILLNSLNLIVVLHWGNESMNTAVCVRDSLSRTYLRAVSSWMGRKGREQAPWLAPGTGATGEKLCKLVA